MKGVIFNLLEQAVSDEYGEGTWDQLLEETNLDGAYTSVGNYPDEELMALVKAGSEATNIDADELVEWFGTKSIPLLAERYPAFFAPHTSTRDFVLTLNDVIHPEVRKLFPGAYAPQFEFDASDPEELVLGYISYRNLCSFAEGLIKGAAQHFGEEATVSQRECSKKGGDRCVFVCSFRKL